MVGRKRRSLADVMRTKVWLSEMQRITGCDNINQFAEMLMNLKVDSGKHLYQYGSGGRTITETKLVLIDRNVFGGAKPKSKSPVKGSQIFELGPISRNDATECVPLWDALDGTMEQAWSVLVRYDPPIAIQRYMKDIPFKRRLAYVVSRCFGKTDPPSYWEEVGNGSKHENFVAAAYANGKLSVDLELIAAAIAAWRLAHFVGDSVAMMDYLLIGLLDRAIPECMQPYGIAQDLVHAIGDRDCQYLSELDAAFNDFIYDAPTYPVTEIVNDEVVHQGYDQPHTHGFLLARIKRASVAAYLGREPAKESQPPAQATPST